MSTVVKELFVYLVTFIIPYAYNTYVEYYDVLIIHNACISSQSIRSSRMRNQEGHGMCWISTGRKNGFM